MKIGKPAFISFFLNWHGSSGFFCGLMYEMVSFTRKAG